MGIDRERERELNVVMEDGVDSSPRVEVGGLGVVSAFRGVYKKLGDLEREKKWVGVADDWRGECRNLFRGLSEERIVVKDGAVYFNPGHLNLVDRPNVIGGGFGRDARHDDYWMLGERIDDKPEAISAVAEQLGIDLGDDGDNIGGLTRRVFAWGRERKTDGLPKGAVINENGVVVVSSEKVLGLSLHLDMTGGLLNMDVHFSRELIGQLANELKGEKGKAVVNEFSRRGK